MNNTTPNPIFSKFDAALGKTTPTTVNTPVSTRADEIRNIAKTTQASTESNPLNSDGQLKAITDAGSDLHDSVTGQGKYQGVNPVVAGVEGSTNALATPVKIAGQALHSIGNKIDPESTKFLEDKVSKVTEGVGGVINWLGNKLGSTDLAQKFVQQHPDAAKTLDDFSKMGEAGGQTAGNILLAEGGVKGTTEAGNIASDTKSLFTNSAPKVLDEKSILDKYNRAIKPSVTGRGTAAQAAQADSKIISGIKAINENKSTLEFTDSEGNIVKGESPKSVDQMSQAISQTKKSIYEKYDALAKQAGEKGVSVDAPSIAKELQPIVDSKSLNIANPGAVAYAKDLMDRLTKTGSVDAKTAQEVIQHYNESLKAYYRNPSYDTASKASIDAMVANKFRESLDNGITGATGEQYQALKDQYGSLSSMEKDVARRNTVWSRQNSVGLADNISNIASGAELMKGLIRLNPTDIAVSGAIKGIQKYVKYLNNPDVGVSKIFSDVEKASPASTGSMSGSGVRDTKSSSSSKPTTFEPKSQTGKMIKSIKNIPNKEGGFVSIGGKTFKSISDATKKELIQAIDYLRIGKSSPGIEDTVSNLAKKYNVSEDMSNESIAKKFENLIENTKTS